MHACHNLNSTSIEHHPLNPFVTVNIQAIISPVIAAEFFVATTFYTYLPDLPYTIPTSTNTSTNRTSQHSRCVTSPSSSPSASNAEQTRTLVGVKLLARR
ncbi:uncharacterized protein BDV14DRAFT_165050 [Aspergillus stella-maris]|uniref:uncharacterized protein n=1 Tax=Aspergillus stella-maris TaxID=1810926 RepID=UPI003CCD0007